MTLWKPGVVLLALLLAAMAMVPMVSAEGNSSDQFQTQQNETSKTALITFDGLSVSTSHMLNEKRSMNAVSSSIAKYETLNIDAKTLKTQLLSGKQVPVHLNGIPYFMDLHEETFYPSAETGVYTFNGKLVTAKGGRTLPESNVQLTMDDSGVLGRISVDSSEYIYLDEISNDYPKNPEQQIAYSSKDVTQHKIDLTNDLIVELPSGEIKPVALLSDEELNWLKTERENIVKQRSDSVKTVSGQRSATLDSMVDVKLLIVTDNTMYSGYSNWKKRAQSVLNDANSAFGVNYIKIRLVPIFDDSKRMELSQNFNPSAPFSVFHTIVNNDYLTTKGADIAIYLSGIPFTGPEIGVAEGYDGTNYRHAVMSYEAMPGYVANAQDRAYVFTHEIGHLFDGDHQDGAAAPYQEPYNRAINYSLSGAVKQTTMYSTVSQDPLIFSTDDGVHGDNNHNNALRLKETKGYVSGYVP
ncbi:MAG: zinc-dependent metalloprotease [Methanoregula sp.]|uniref:M12 family metallo-peptidase n=1 Tax=Methanoregula sp. TaxID=2052170 RepID=UPI0025E14CF9|nr:M12 family metallo-peptidase [Methanoregula sp.]MCK9630037.1 zinc-dependent metalloprotease [Methanoregula sp.]